MRIQLLSNLLYVCRGVKGSDGPKIVHMEVQPQGEKDFCTCVLFVSHNVYSIVGGGVGG